MDAIFFMEANIEAINVLLPQIKNCYNRVSDQCKEK
jgi:hypothetical protein